MCRKWRAASCGILSNSEKNQGRCHARLQIAFRSAVPFAEPVFTMQVIDDAKLPPTASLLSAGMQTADDVGQGGEAWIGYKQDLRPCQFGLSLTLEPSFSVFFQGKPVTEFVEVRNAGQSCC